MRTTFVNTLTRLASKNRNIWLLTGDLGFSVLEKFRDKIPNQYLNVGVAEQNMVGIAAGLALSGKTVFVYSIVPFITLRCLEQVRNDVCIQNANVKLVGVGEGLSYGQLGPTHHSIEDIAVMRSLPNMTVVCPGDPWEVEKTLEAAIKVDSPFYIRIGRSGEKNLNNKNTNFKIGRGTLISEGSDLTIISTGNMLETAVNVSERLRREKVNARIISMHTVKPLDEKLITDSAKKTGNIFTIEEHNVIGGLGSGVAQVLAESNLKVNFKSFGIRDKYTKMAGSQEYLREVNGISTNQIFNTITGIMHHD